MLRYSDPISWITHILVVGFIIFWFMNFFGFIPMYYGENNYESVRQFVNDCELDQKSLIERTMELNKIQNTDIHRAYTECREDLSDERKSNTGSWFIWIIVTVVLITFTYHMTKEHYQTKSRKKNK